MSKQMTQFAMQANTIAEALRSAFAKTQLGDSRIEVTAPEESTRGGHYGLQHVMLRNASGMAIVAASVHVGDRKAELRSYATVARLHNERFKRPPTFSEADYATFLAKSTTLLNAFNLAITTLPDESVPVSSHAVGSTEDASAPGQSKQLIRLAVFALAILVFGGAALLWGTQVLGR